MQNDNLLTMYSYCFEKKKEKETIPVWFERSTMPGLVRPVRGGSLGDVHEGRMASDFGTKWNDA